jgi:hypothetical protein
MLLVNPVTYKKSTVHTAEVFLNIYHSLSCNIKNNIIWYMRITNQFRVSLETETFSFVTGGYTMFLTLNTFPIWLTCL